MRGLSVLAIATLTFCGSATASAQEGLAGSAQGHFLMSAQEDPGAAVSFDITYAFDAFRLGGFFGVGAVFADAMTDDTADMRNRVFMPLGLSAGFEILGEVVGVSIRARGGLWGGATQEEKITVGGFVGGAAYLLFALGDGVGLSVGLDVFGILGAGDTALFAPTLGLTWMPPSEPAAEASP